MKIGVATFTWAHNYGAVLQAFALQSLLEQRGHDVELIDFRVPHANAGYRQWMGKTIGSTLAKWETVFDEYQFESFRRANLHRTHETFCNAKGLRRIRDRYDVVIAGSDQVWNPEWLQQIEGITDLFFLSFVDSHVKRIGYAASFGHKSKETISIDWQKTLCDRLCTFDAISVREQSGVDLVADLTGRKDTVHVPDPTLMHDQSFYQKLAGGRKRSRPILLNFMLHGRESDSQAVCRTLAASHGLRVVNAKRSQTWMDGNAVHPSPCCWLRMIRDASFVVTNSFHAVVFCLIFNTPFVGVLIDGSTGTMNTRLTELLEPLGLTHRLVQPGQAISTDLTQSSIDWSRVARTIGNWRLSAYQFLADQGL